MADFAVAKGDAMRKRFAVGGRIVMAAVVVGNLTGLFGSVAAAVYSKEAGDFSMSASAAYAANKGDVGDNFNNFAVQKASVANEAGSVQSFCEVATLLIIILGFAGFGIASARRVSSALRILNDNVFGVEQEAVAAVAAAGRQLRLQIVGTAAFVFVTFLLRAVFSIMNALANALQSDGTGCTSDCDPSCNNLWEVIQAWLAFTPEFQLSVVLISSPLALLVALWGMTSNSVLQHMKSSRGQMARLRNNPLLGAE